MPDIQYIVLHKKIVELKNKLNIKLNQVNTQKNQKSPWEIYFQTWI